MITIIINNKGKSRQAYSHNQIARYKQLNSHEQHGDITARHRDVVRDPETQLNTYNTHTHTHMYTNTNRHE